MIPTLDDALIEFVPSPTLTPDRDDNDEPEAIIITNKKPLYDLNAISDQPFLYDLNAIADQPFLYDLNAIADQPFLQNMNISSDFNHLNHLHNRVFKANINNNTNEKSNR
jgi:hypothetical protein